MNRFFAPLAVSGILGCASAPVDSWEIDAAPEREPSFPIAPPVVSAEVVSTPEPIRTEVPEAEFDLDSASAPDAIDPQAPMPPPPQHPARSRFTLKGGSYSLEDTDALDDGYILTASWMNFFSPHFATEFELGYIDADGSIAGRDTDMWGIPFMFNARFSAPVSKVELYGGLGFGSFFYDFSVSNGPDADGWVPAADTFFGATMTLKNSIVIGLEGKYYFTESIHALDGGLDAYAVMLTVGVGR